MRLFLLIPFLCVSLAVFSQSDLPKREFRAAWVATVNNIDWPSKPGLSIEIQKKEAIALLNKMQENHFNAVIFQVRPASDAFYESAIEPWSRYLTGNPGQSPGYDPIRFWIEEAHNRNMEFHAWFNPYRVAQRADEPLASSHVAFQHPEWIIQYDKKLFFDPGYPGALHFITQVVKDVVARYDVDAIHFDDYFYPYPAGGQVFPDSASFRLFNRGHSIERLADWRRENVDKTIQSLGAAIKQTKPWVKFGISPFGVWRNQNDDPRGSATRAGITNYDHLYADILKWVEKGWIDYVLPQVYWEIGHPAAEFATLCQWWQKNAPNRALYIGHALYKVDPAGNNAAWKTARQLTEQVNYLRQLPKIGGSAFYSGKYFLTNLGGVNQEMQHVYGCQALVPTMPWIDNRAPGPVKTKKRGGNKIQWKETKEKNEADRATRYVVYRTPHGAKFDPNDPSHIVLITSNRSVRFERGSGKEKFDIRVSALDRLQNESIASRPKTIKQ